MTVTDWSTGLGYLQPSSQEAMCETLGHFPVQSWVSTEAGNIPPPDCPVTCGRCHAIWERVIPPTHTPQKAQAQERTGL